MLLAHPLTFGTRLVAEKLGIRWASSHLFPMSLFSVFDPPLVSVAPNISRMRFLGPRFFRFALQMGKRHVRPWSEPWHRLRSEIGLEPAADPLFDGAHSRAADFGPLLTAACQPPARLAAADGRHRFSALRSSGRRNAAGVAPIFGRRPAPAGFHARVGSRPRCRASFTPRVLAAAQLLGRRAILLTGSGRQNCPSPLPPGVAAFEYAPFSELFPRAAAIVHHGGIGTTTQALRAGRPMLVMPYAYDQPDNAERVCSAGRRSRHFPPPLHGPPAPRPSSIDCSAHPPMPSVPPRSALRVRAEDGVAIACDALEAAHVALGPSAGRPASPRRRRFVAMHWWQAMMPGSSRRRTALSSRGVGYSHVCSYRLSRSQKPEYP